MHLLHKGFMENYWCWYAHGEVFVCNKSMREMVVGSTSSASNVLAMEYGYACNENESR